MQSSVKYQDKNPEEQTEVMIKYKFRYYVYNPNRYIISVIFSSLFSIISIELISILIAINFGGILFWVFDLFFIAYINLIMFEIPIYPHKKFAIIFIIIVSFFFKFLSIYEYISNDRYNLFYKNHIILIPIIIIFYICLSLLRFYSLCKIKWLLDFKFIPFNKFVVIYNFIGMIIFLMASLISSFVKCADKSKINDIDLLCFVKMEVGDKTEYYFDSFSYFFQQLWRKDRNAGYNILYLFLFFIQLFLNFLRIIYSTLIISRLSPEFYLCSFEIYCFLIRLIELIRVIIDDDGIKTEIYNLIAEIGSLIGIMIYLELIELKFCGLNSDIKKNIEFRAIAEYKINNLYNEVDDEDNENSSIELDK